MVGELESRIVDIEVELIKFSRSLPLAYTDSMTLTDFFDYAEILRHVLNSEKQESGNGLGESIESVIERNIPAGLRGLGIPGLG